MPILYATENIANQMRPKIATSDHHTLQHTKTFFSNGAARVPESPMWQDGSRNVGVLEVRSSRSFYLVPDNAWADFSDSELDISNSPEIITLLFILANVKQPGIAVPKVCSVYPKGYATSSHEIR